LENFSADFFAFFAVTGFDLQAGAKAFEREER